MIKYKDGRIDERKVSYLVNFGQYHDSLKVIFDDASELVLLDFYYCFDGTDPIRESVNILDSIDTIVLDGDTEVLNATMDKVGKAGVERFIADHEIRKGDSVRVIKGRKYPIGLEFTVLKIDYYRAYSGLVSTTYALGLIDGSWIKADVKNLEWIPTDGDIQRVYDSAITDYFTWHCSGYNLPALRRDIEG